MHLCPDGIADFIRTLQDSGTRHSEWAIGPYVKKIIVDGRLVPWNLDLRMSTFVCPLSLLSVLLSRLPRLTSLRLSKVLISNDIMPSPNADAGLCDRPRFTLDELVLSDCSAPAHEPHHLPALICLFSNIGSLWVVRWGKSRPGPRHIFPSAASSPPVVRSITIEDVSDVIAVHAVYALLSRSLAVSTGHLARVAVHAAEENQLSAFSGFAGAARRLFSELELHVVRPSRERRSLFSVSGVPLTAPTPVLSAMPLAPCTALRLLVLHIEYYPSDWSFGNCQSVSNILHAYARLLREHRSAFPVLASVRLGIGPRMFNAFRDAAIDNDAEAHRNAGRTSAEGVQQNRDVWESLDGALRKFSALKSVEFMLYEEPSLWKDLAEDEKIKLRGALKRRLPALWRTQSGAAQLVFEPSDYWFRRYRV